MIKHLIIDIIIALPIVFFVAEIAKLIVYGWFSKKVNIESDEWSKNSYSINIIYNNPKDKTIRFCKMPDLHILSKWYIMGSPNKQVFRFSKLHKQIEKAYKELLKN